MYQHVRFMTKPKLWLIALGLVYSYWINPAVAHEDHSTLVNEFNPNVQIEIKGDFIQIHTNGIPDHSPGAFPNSGNPHSIKSQNKVFQIPLHPQILNAPIYFDQRTLFGIARNGIVFDPSTAEFYNPETGGLLRGGRPQQGGQGGGPPKNIQNYWNFEAFLGGIPLGIDQHNAHVQPDGTYHYHGIPNGLISSEHATSDHSILVGFAADGFPVYAKYGYDLQNSNHIKELKSSYRIRTGNRPNDGYAPKGAFDGRFTQDWEYIKGSGDLDACNGRFAPTPRNLNGEYAYFLTDQFPFVPRCFMGQADRSFVKAPPNGGGQMPQMPPIGGKQMPPTGGGQPPQIGNGNHQGQAMICEPQGQADAQGQQQWLCRPAPPKPQ